MTPQQNQACDLDAEIDLLARILQDPPGQVHLVAHVLRSEHFFRARHGIVYSAALGVLDAHQPVDIGNVHAWLRDKGQLDAAEYGKGTVREFLLAELQFHVPHLKTEVAAKRIREKYALRMLGAAAARIAIQAGSSQIDDVETFCEQAETALHAVSHELIDGVRTTDVFSIFDIVGQISTDMLQGKQRAFVPTGFRELDEDMGGLEYGFVTVMGAPTNWGKSNFAVMIADEADRVGRNVLVVTFEDSPKLYGKRFVARRQNISAVHLKNHALGDVDRSNLLAFAEEAALKYRKPFILNAGGRPIENVVRRVTRICQSQRVDLVVWDYLQAAKCRERVKDKRDRVEFCMREMVDCSRNAGVAALIMSQFRRMQPGESPTIGHLKESGDIENGADYILLGFNDAAGVPRIRLAKCKDSPTNFDYSLAWNPRSASFAAGSRLEQDRRPRDRHDYQPNDAH